MIGRYESRNVGDYVKAHREILQELALLGLWRGKFLSLASLAVEKLDAAQARREVEPFVKNPEALTVWSKEFFHEVVKKITLICYL